MGSERAGPDGFVLCDKPAGITSHDVVAQARRRYRAKAGHAGTLDPFATGLLIVLLGRATRLQRYLLGLPKTYWATARLGWRSDTGDPDGELRETGVLPEEPALPTGTITQRVPMTSAVKVGGERLYRKAHRGEEVATPEREVTIHRADLLEADGEHARYEIECSSGTYIRTLIETLGDAYCEELRRVAIGPFRIEQASEEVLAPAAAVPFLAERALSAEEAKLAVNGVAVPARPTGDAAREIEGAGEAEAEPVRLTEGGRLVAIAEPRDGVLHPRVVLA